MKLKSFVTIGVAILVGIPVFAKTAATEARYPSHVITFSKGSAALTPSLKKEIADFVNTAKSKDKVGEIYVAAWADQVRVGEKSLSEADEELARQRARNVSRYIEDSLNTDTDTFNMAKHSSLWGRVFGTEEARVKGAKPTNHDIVAQRIQNDGKPSSVVLVAEPEGAPNRMAE